MMTASYASSVAAARRGAERRAAERGALRGAKLDARSAQSSSARSCHRDAAAMLSERIQGEVNNAARHDVDALDFLMGSPSRWPPC